MRARECSKLFRTTSQYLTATTEASVLASELCSKLGASLLRRPCNTNPGQATVSLLKCVSGGTVQWKASCINLQFCCGPAPAGSPSFSTFAAGQVSGKNSSICPSAAAFAVRRLATATASPSTSQKVQETAKGKMQSILAAPSAAVQSAKQGVRNTTNAVYKQMPRPVSLSQLHLYATWCLYGIVFVVLSYKHCRHNGGSPQWASQVVCSGLSPFSLKHSGRPTDGRSSVRQPY